MKEPIKVAEPGTPEWYAARLTGLGASEIAAAAGLDEYMTPLGLYAVKTGLDTDDVEDEGDDPRRMGRLLEPIVKSEFARRRKITFLDPHPPMYRHPEHEFIIATPDAVITEDSLLEAKTASWRMADEWGEEGTDCVPTNYLLQCQTQMAVMGADIVHLAVLFDGSRLKMFEVLRNDELIALVIAAASELWQRIKDRNPPEPTWEHPTTPKLVKAMHKTIADTRIVLSDAEVAMWSEYENLGKQIGLMNERRDMLKAKVIHAIGDNYAGLLGDGRMVRRKSIYRNGYFVESMSYTDVRATKADKGPVIERLVQQ